MIRYVVKKYIRSAPVSMNKFGKAVCIPKTYTHWAVYDTINECDVAYCDSEEQAETLITQIQIAEINYKDYLYE